MKSVKPYLELLALLVVMLALGFWLSPEDPFFNKMRPSPYLIVVVLGAIKYGSPFGLIVGVICGALDLVLAQMNVDGSLKNAIFFEPTILIAPGVYIAVGHYIGEAVHSSQKRNDFAKNQAVERKKLADSLAGEKAELEGRYRQLEGKIASESKSSYSFVKSLAKFDTLEQQMLSEYAVEITEKYVQAKSAQYWIKSKDKWELLYPTDSQTDIIPGLLLKAETLDTWATCRDYPEIAGCNGGDVALCKTGRNENEVHALVCFDIPFTEWAMTLEDTLNTILREATRASDIWNLRLSLGEVAPIEQRLRLESLRMFKNQVHRQLLTLRRNDSLSTLIFIKIGHGVARDIRVLGVIASSFRSLLRMSDGMSYVQDDEYFILFLPQTPKIGGEIVLKKVNQALDTLHLTPHQKQIELVPTYYELTTAEMLEQAFEAYGKGE